MASKALTGDCAEAFASSGVGMVWVDADWRIVEANTASFSMLGYEKDELIGKSILEVTHPDDRSMTEDKNRKLFGGKITSFQLEKRYLTKNGETVWVSISPSVIERDEAGKPKLAFSVIANISARKRLELALIESEMMYHTLVDLSPEAIVIVQDNKIVFANKAVINYMKAKDVEEIIGKPALFFVHPDSKKSVSERLKQMLLTNKPAPTIIEKYISLDGKVLDAEVTSAPIIYKGKKAIQVVIHDVTNRMVMIEKLRASEEKYRTLAEAAHDMIFVIERDGTISYANSVAASQFGMKPQEMIGRKRSEFFGPIAQSQDVSLNQVFETGESIYRETRTPFGKKMIWLGTWLVPLKTDGKTVSVLGLSRDISKQKETETNLLKLNRALKESEESYRGLFDSVAEAIYVQDANGKFLDVNEGAVKMYGYPREWFVDKSPLDVAAPGKNDIEKIGEAVKRAFEGEAQEFEFWGVRSNGEVFPKDVRLYKGKYFGKDVVIALATDITARKKNEDDLREREERFRSLFSNMLDGFALCEMIYDEKKVPIDFVYLNVNDKFAELTGLTNVVGRKVSELIPGLRESNPELFELYDKAASAGESGRIESYVPQLSIWFSISVYSPKKGQFVAVFSNITDKKRAEHDFVASELRYRRLFEAAKDGVLIVDFDSGAILDVNQFLVDLVGYSKEEFLTKALWDVGVFENIVASKESFDELKSKSYVRFEDQPMETRDGRHIDVEFVSNVYDVAGVKTIQCNVRNITERKKAEKEIVEGKAKLEAILDSLTEGVFVIDREGKIVLFNPAMSKMSGYSVDEVRDRPYWEVLSFVSEGLSAEKRDFIRQALEGKTTVFSSNTLLNTKVDEQVPVSGSAAQIKGVEEHGLVVILRDVSREREVDRMRDEFMMVASHELRAPMTAIKWLLSMALDGTYGAVETKLRESLLGMSVSVDRLIHLVNDMINVSRIQEGHLKFKLEDIDIKGLVIASVQSFEAEASRKQIKILTEIENIKVRTDGDKLSQILNNLLDNAIKFTPSGGGIVVKATKEGGDLMIEVADNGVGIAPELTNKLFEKFSQITTHQEGRSQGTGLGLFISRELARSLGGELWLKSSVVGKGSVFGLKLPLVLVIKKGVGGG